MGKPDPVVLDFAKQETRLLLTHNCEDFEALHQANPNHSGILAIYRGEDASKNMSYGAIVRAITNLETSNIRLDHQFIPLNPWNY